MDYRRKARLPGHSVRILLLFNAKGRRAADADVMGTPHRYRAGACRRARAVRRPRYPRAQSLVTTRDAAVSRLAAAAAAPSRTPKIRSAQNGSAPPHPGGLLPFFLSVVFWTRTRDIYFVFIFSSEFTSSHPGRYGKFNQKKKNCLVLHPLLSAKTRHATALSRVGAYGVLFG